jgi:alkanesulfonate monooxygenase SsuD/methylene tetrahydromethanopterin reductase-like flavin-dependent oxidoreductase (luciferase family)
VDYGKPLSFGVFVIPDATAPQRAIESAIAADELGFDLVGVQDHPYQRRFYDTFILLTAMAMRTERITLFPDVANLPLRPPAMVAKAAASLDILSDGRFELGLGAGGFWDAIEAYGGPRRSPGESVDALEEAIQVIRLLWSAERSVRFEGRHYQIAGAHPGPRPVHDVGIWLGAYRPRMLSLIGRLADGWVPSLGYLKPPDLSAGNERVDEAARAAGRDPKAIRRVLNVGLYPDGETVDVLVELATEHGMDTFMVPEDGEDPRAHLEKFAGEVFPRVRERVEKIRGSR